MFFGLLYGVRGRGRGEVILCCRSSRSSMLCRCDSINARNAISESSRRNLQHLDGAAEVKVVTFALGESAIRGPQMHLDALSVPRV